MACEFHVGNCICWAIVLDSQPSLTAILSKFAKEKKFTNEQLSAFFTLLQVIIQNISMWVCMCNQLFKYFYILFIFLLKEEFSLDNSMKNLKSHLAGVGVSKLTSLQCFSVETATLAIQYFSCSIFKHYHLFKYLFSEEQEEDHVPVSVSLFHWLIADSENVSIAWIGGVRYLFG